MTVALRAAFGWATQQFGGLHFGDRRLSKES